MAENTNTEKKHMVFAAIDPYYADNIIKSDEKKVRGVEFVQWGTKNIYPSYLYDLYEKSSTLHSIINGIVDYVAGDEIKSNLVYIDDEEMTDLVRTMALQYAIFGGITLNILRNKLGNVCRILPMDIRNVRTDEDKRSFYYSREFGNKSYGRQKYNVYPHFDINEKTIASSVYMYTNDMFKVYPSPTWMAATLSAEIESEIAKYHYNSIRNGFASNVVISFNNGIPTDEVKNEICEMFEDKYTGSENAQRPIINFAQDKDHAVEVNSIDTDSFADRYTALTKKVSQDLFTAFRANPNLFAINTENNGFSQEQFADSFALFNKTTVKPIQRLICNILNKISGSDSSVEIKPFTINFENNATSTTTVE